MGLLAILIYKADPAAPARTIGRLRILMNTLDPYRTFLITTTRD